MLHVILVVSRGLPQVDVEHVGTDHFSKASEGLLSPDDGHHLVLEAGAISQEKISSRRVGIYHEQFLLLPQAAVVSALGFLNSVDLLIQLFFRGEGCTLDPLKIII